MSSMESRIKMNKKELNLKEAYDMLEEYSLEDTNSFVQHFSIEVIQDLIKKIENDDEVNDSIKQDFKTLLEKAIIHNQHLVAKEQAEPQEFDERWEKFKKDITEIFNKSSI